jgi:hypothetical protein
MTAEPGASDPSRGESWLKRGARLRGGRGRRWCCPAPPPGHRGCRRAGHCRRSSPTPSKGATAATPIIGCTGSFTCSLQCTIPSLTSTTRVWIPNSLRRTQSGKIPMPGQSDVIEHVQTQRITGLRNRHVRRGQLLADIADHAVVDVDGAILRSRGSDRWAGRPSRSRRSWTCQRFERLPL